jgi:hypothetical protein
MEVRGTVEHDAHGPRLIVFTDVGDGMEEIGVLEAGHGDQEMVGKVGFALHASDCISVLLDTKWVCVHEQKNLRLTACMIVTVHGYQFTVYGFATNQVVQEAFSISISIPDSVLLVPANFLFY